MKNNLRPVSSKKKRRKKRRLHYNTFLLIIIITISTFFIFKNLISDSENIFETDPDTNSDVFSVSSSNDSSFIENPDKIEGNRYLAEDFDIQVVKSTTDFNDNGIDDFTDFLLGAKKEALSRPVYDESYWEGGYPPDGTGVCTDVIWRAFAHAGYDLKQMIDDDIARYPEDYNLMYGISDPNIDFRRVPNLLVFFSKYAISLTIDPYDIDQWQPGDIVIYGERHIAIISDFRNHNGVSYIIHNSDDHDEYEEDFLIMDDLSGHYRFDVTQGGPAGKIQPVRFSRMPG